MTERGPFENAILAVDATEGDDPHTTLPCLDLRPEG